VPALRPPKTSSGLNASDIRGRIRQALLTLLPLLTSDRTPLPFCRISSSLVCVFQHVFFHPLIVYGPIPFLYHCQASRVTQIPANRGCVWFCLFLFFSVSMLLRLSSIAIFALCARTVRIPRKKNLPHNRAPLSSVHFFLLVLLLLCGFKVIGNGTEGRVGQGLTWYFNSASVLCHFDKLLREGIEILNSRVCFFVANS